ncbi:hypothetical protein ScPMuIL_001883 [Solemya velum]
MPEKLHLSSISFWMSICRTPQKVEDHRCILILHIVNRGIPIPVLCPGRNIPIQFIFVGLHFICWILCTCCVLEVTTSRNEREFLTGWAREEREAKIISMYITVSSHCRRNKCL